MASTSRKPGTESGPGKNPGQETYEETIEEKYEPSKLRRMEEVIKDDPTLDPKELGMAYAAASADEYIENSKWGYKKGKAKVGFFRGQLGKRNALFLIGGPVTFAIIVIAFLFFTLLPFKLLDVVDTLQNHFFGSSENAVGDETNSLFSDYLRKYVLPSLKICPGATTKSCTAESVSGRGLVSRLYKGWRYAHLEEKLATVQGLEFKYDSKSHHFFLKTNDTTGEGIDLGTSDGSTGFIKEGDSLDDYLANKAPPSDFKLVSRSELRSAVNDALGDDTDWKSVMYRFKVGGLLEKKYGLQRCIIACDARDTFNDWKNNTTRAAKLIIAERVLLPLSEGHSLVVLCVISGNCNPNTKVDDGLNGEPQSNADSKLQAALAALAAKEDGKYEDVLAHVQGIVDDGYQKYLAKVVLAAILGDESAQGVEDATSNAVPVLGWVNSAAQTLNIVSEAPEIIKDYSYITNAAAMVGMYETYRTFADETKTGNVDPGILGSFEDSLGPGDSSATGGTASAEQAPLYNYLINGNAPSSSTTLSSSLDGQAYTASTSSNSNYICANGKPVPAGQLVCSEEVLGGSNSQLNSLQTITSKDLGPLTYLSHVWSNISSPVQDAVEELLEPALSAIPGIGDLKSAITDAIGPIIKSFTNYLIPTPFSDDMSGARTFDMIAGGADASGNDFAHNGLGGQVLTNNQLATILDQQNQQDLQSYQSQSMFAKMFDTSSLYSPITKLAMAMPNSFSSFGGSMASFFSDPFGEIFRDIGSIFTMGKVSAATVTVVNDPFDITQYGYPENDPALAAANANPEAYWDNNCSSDGTDLDWTDPSKVNAQWINSQYTNPDTGQPENSTTDPCLLIQAAVGSAGALFESGVTGSLLTADDLAGTPSATTSGTTSTTSSSSSNSTTSNSSGGTTSGGNVSVYRDPFHGCSVNQERIDQGIDYSGTCTVYAIGTGTVDQVDPVDSGWLGGSFITYKLTDPSGAAYNNTIYVAEDCTPASGLHSGESVTSSTAICDMYNGQEGIETGWGQAGSDVPLARILQPDCYDNANDGTATNAGLSYSNLMTAIGGPPGNTSLSTDWPETVCILPQGFPTTW